MSLRIQGDGVFLFRRRFRELYEAIDDLKPTHSCRLRNGRGVVRPVSNFADRYAVEESGQEPYATLSNSQVLFDNYGLYGEAKG